jgi:glutamyl endopeptidase
MNVARIRRWVGAAIGVAALVAVPLTPAVAAPATPVAAAPAATAANTLTMVNGAGRTITVPKTAVAAGAANASFAGSAGSAPSAKGSAIKAPGHTSPAIGPKPNTVLGPDGRVQESVPNDYPWRAIVYMTTNQGQCTGFMMSRDVVVTAGHCVYEGGWVTSYRIVPAKNGGSEPYGSCSGGIADVWTTSSWISTGSADNDYGLIKLTCDIGNTVGWFGWWYNTGENLVNQFFFVEGFPGDHPAQMWWDGDVVNQQSATRMFYSIDTAPGESGSPIYHFNSVTAGLCGGWCVTGIHTNGPFDSAFNSGTRFTPTVMSFINFWIGQP